jgi:hypothetical protein
MAKISTPNAAPAIRFLPNSNHWRLMGLEITTSFSKTGYPNFGLVAAGLQADGSTSINVQAQLPAYLIFDRIYIHGLSDASTKRGIQMDTQDIAIVDSYCDEIHALGQDSQCFGSWNGSGPFLIQNNFIQAGAENIMFGGADPAITNLVPSDISIVGNLIQKNTAWRGRAAPYNWVVKNLFELKNAQRVLLDGNVLQYTWAEAQDEALIIRSANQSGACTWCVVQDVTVTHNIIQHAPIGVVLAPIGGLYPALPTGRVLIQNNVLNDISSVNWGTRGCLFQLVAETAFPVHDWIIDHNTGFDDGCYAIIGDSGTIQNLQLTNNIGTYGTYGIFGSGASPGNNALNLYAPVRVYDHMVFITSSGTCLRCTYPSGTFYNTQTGVDFTNYAGGNFQLTSSSPYYHAGTDGKDVGVWDWTCLNSDSAAALAGRFVSGTNGCALSVDLLLQPPTAVSAVVQ